MAAINFITSLADIPHLKGLASVCEKYNVDITAFGSLVRRILRHNIRGDGQNVDLFTLVPFLSDIDLRHSGKSSLTPQIRRAILSAVPYSECFRWDIFSNDELADFDQDEERLPVIPLNKLRLGTLSSKGVIDPFGAAAELKGYRFTLLDNPYYFKSTLRRGHRDVELLHALSFLQIACEESPERSLTTHPGWERCQELINRSIGNATTISLGESSYLRARIKYRIAALLTSCRSERMLWEAFIDSGLFRFCINYGMLPFERLFRQVGPWGQFSDAWLNMTVSCRIGGDIFRSFGVFESSSEMKESPERLWRNLSEKHVPLRALSNHPIPQLPPNHRVLAASPVLAFNAGSAPSALNGEHVHIQFTLSEESAGGFAEVPSEALGMIVVLSAETVPRDTPQNISKSHGIAFALPGRCALEEFIKTGGSVPYVQARVNFGNLLTAFPEWARRLLPEGELAPKFQLFVVAQIRNSNAD